MKNSTIHNEYQQLQAFSMINPDTLFNPRPLAYSHAVEVRHFLRVLHISAQAGQNKQGQLSTDFEKQVEQSFKNIRCILDEADATLLDIAVLRIYLVDFNSKKHQILIQVMQHIWNQHPFPACTLVSVTGLTMPNLCIEIEATAYCL